MRSSIPRGARSAIVGIVLLAATAGTAVAQTRPGPAIEVAAGILNFPDDGTVTEPFLGGAARFYVTPRISLGPEIAWISGENHSHLMLMGNLTFDFLRPESGPVTPFVVLGAGLFQSRQLFLNDGTFSHTEGSFTAGGGIRGRIGKHVTAGMEARVGWELHIRLNATIGIQWGR